MTQEDKDLVLKDLCARLPYHVKIQSWYGEVITSDINTFPCSTEEMDAEDMWDQLSDFKPYLRSMSSMTEEEKIELCTRAYAPDEMKTIEEKLQVIKINAKYAADFYNEHHFDYRGLIERGLAIEVTEENNPYKS